MKTVTTVKLTGADTYILRKMTVLGNLIGIQALDKKDPLRRAFGRFQSGAAELQDIETCLNAALKIADDLESTVETRPCPFPQIPGQDFDVEAHWRQSEREHPPRIRRAVEDLRAHLSDAMGRSD